jgi:deazaflavin-dependent oxidoreductase (nitroreductase family)
MSFGLPESNLCLRSWRARWRSSGSPSRCRSTDTSPAGPERREPAREGGRTCTSGPWPHGRFCAGEAAVARRKIGSSREPAAGFSPMAADRAWARLGELRLTEERAVSVATHERDLHSRGWRLSNAIVGVLARAGLGPMHLLSTRGRRTGLIYTTPVVPVEHAGGSWLVAPYGPVSWVLNARAAGQVSLRHGRTRRDHAVREVGPGEAGPVLKRYVRVATKNPAVLSGRRRLSGRGLRCGGGATPRLRARAGRHGG